MTHFILTEEGQAQLRAKHPPFSRRVERTREEDAFPDVAMPRDALAIAARVSREYGVDLREMVFTSRWGCVGRARSQAMAEIRALRHSAGEGRTKARYTLARIGMMFGGRDHSTVRAAIQRHEGRSARCQSL